MGVLRRAIESLLSLFFPRLCLVCGNSLVEGEQHLCLHCLDIMPRTRYHLERDNALEKIFWGKVSVERVTALFYFYKGGGYRDLIHAIKYRDGKSCARYMGFIAAEIALGIANHIGVPVWSDKLIRTKHNPTQTQMKRDERWDNVSTIFSLVDVEALDGKHILLVDDVITSGSTLEACVRELQRVADVRVSILTLATV